MMRIGIAVALGVLLCAPSTAVAQVEYHLYGGGALGTDSTRGAFGGAGLTAGAGAAGAVGQRAAVRGVYFSVDGHGLWLNEAGKSEFQRLSRITGADLALEAIGLDFSFGGVISSSSGRVKVIPVGLIGFTENTLTTCLRGSSCDEETETQINYGAGFVTAFKGGSGRGVHVGFRYTRNYGAALSLGFVFTSG